MVTIPKETYFNLNKEKQNRIFEAALDEFAAVPYETVKLSNIIKKAGIPRGSFYQYFEDKKDIFTYIMDKAGEAKIKSMKGLISNEEGKPFLTLLKELYMAGIKFAFDNPKFVQVSQHLMSTKGAIFQELMEGNINLALSIYSNMIEVDKEKGLIRKDVDTAIFAKMVLDMTLNVAIEENDQFEEFNAERMFTKVIQIIDIIQKGVRTGE